MRTREDTWRILVLGNSITTQVARRTRADGTYSQALEWLLRDSGYHTAVRNAGRWFDEIDQGMERFVEQEFATFPDVLIVHYGFNEMRSYVLPRRVLQHFTRMRLHTWDEGITRVGRTHRQFIVPRLWPLVRRYQQVASTSVGQRLWRMTPERFARELRRLIGLARHERMLVLVADINPPGPKIAHFLPGVADRSALYQRTITETVLGFDDEDVRLVQVSNVVNDLGIEQALPDSLHLSPLAHQGVAAMLAAEIGPWLDAQAQERGWKDQSDH